MVILAERSETLAGKGPKQTLVILAAAACAGLLLLATASPAFAQDKDSERDELVVLSGGANVTKGETVGDVVVFDGPVNIAGRAQGTVAAFNGRVTVSGSVAEDVIAFKGRVTIQDGARVGGDVHSISDANVSRGARVQGDVGRINPRDFEFDAFGVGAAKFAIWAAVTVSTFLLGLLIVVLLPRAADATFEAGNNRPGASAGWGLLWFFAIPLLGVLLLVTVVGIPLGLGLLLAMLPLYSLGYTMSAWFVGRKVVGPPRSRFLALLAGIVILRVIALIPILGGLVWLAATIFGLGLMAAGAPKRDQPAVAPAGAAAHA